MNDCIFCKIMAGIAPASVVYEDELCKVFLDIQPVTPGHLLVVPKQHYVGLSDLPEDLGGHLFQVGQKMAAALKKSTIPCDDINFFLADGALAFQSVFHVHLHVIPRTPDDGFGLTFGENYRKLPDRETLNHMAQALRSSI